MSKEAKVIARKMVVNKKSKDWGKVKYHGGELDTRKEQTIDICNLDESTEN